MFEMGTLSEDGFSQLVDRATGGDRDALGELLHRHTDLLQWFIAARLPVAIRSTVDVDDVVQDTFRVAVRGIVHFRPRNRASFVAWLRTIADSRLIDLARACRRKKRGGNLHRLSSCGHATGSVINLLDLFVADEATPFHQACQREAALLTRMGMAALPPAHREALRLQFYEGRRTREIARVLDRTPGAVAGLLKRSKQKLRQTLRDV